LSSNKGLDDQVATADAQMIVAISTAADISGIVAEA